MNSVGLSLGKLTVVRFTGKDRVRVYNNLCTQDLRNATSGQCLETFITDVKGKTFGHGMAAYFDDEALFVSAPGYGERLAPHFDRYIIREDAQVADVSANFNAWLFPNAESVAFLFSERGVTPPINGCATKYEFEGCDCFALSVEWIGSGALLILVKSRQSAESDLQSGALESELNRRSTNSDTTQRADWERQRIEAFWPWYGVDFDEKNLPQELSRDAKAISFNKGCYLGQETIARLDALGQVQKKLVALQFDGMSDSSSITLPAAITADEKEVGTLTSFVPGTTDSSGLGLAMVKRSHFAVGQTVTVGTHRATVIR